MPPKQENKMSASIEKTKKIFDTYNHFLDGLTFSFEYFYNPNEKHAVQMVFYGRDGDGDIWRKVRVVIKDINEVYAKVKENTFNSLPPRVTLLNFENVWRVEVDGNYAMDKDPTSLEEIRLHGERCTFKKTVETYEILD